MKGVKKSTWIILGVLALVVVGVTRQVERNRQSKRLRLNASSNLKQIGLAFRQDHNTYHGRFVLTGEVIAPVPTP